MAITHLPHPSLGDDGRARPTKRPAFAGPGEGRMDPGGVGTIEDKGPEFRDPLLWEEDMAKDVRFVLAFKVLITGDGTPKLQPKTPTKKTR